MSSSKAANTYNYHNWEVAEFPIVCQTCLGDNKNIRMTKETFGKACKICTRPFTVFRWQAGTRGRYKKTEVCQSCSKTKNVCQTCILDLVYGLPVEVRDHAMKINQNLPRGSVNKEYAQQQLEQAMSNADTLDMYSGIETSNIGKMKKNNEMLMKLARTEPYYKRNRPHICSFFVKGECRRGEECPFRHECPTDPDNPLSHQNIKDRFYGVNDPVASKMMNKYRDTPRPIAPEDRTITTLHLGNVMDHITEQSIRSSLYQYGEIRSVSLHSKQKCAFVQFATREHAELAIEKCFDKLIVNGTRLTVNWGRPHVSAVKDGTEGFNSLPAVPGLPQYAHLPPPPLIWPGSIPPSSIPPPPPPPLQNATGFLIPNLSHIPLPTDVSSSSKLSVHYASQDPNRMGGRLQ